MQPTSLAKVLKLAAQYFGRSVADDRDFLVQKINEARSALFKNEAQRKAFFRREDCECVRKYLDDCNSSRCRQFLGITLPVNVIGIEHLERAGRRFSIRSERLDNTRGACGCLEAEILSQRVPLYQDIPAGYKNRIRFLAKDPADKGKKVGVQYWAPDGADIREDLLLDTINGGMTSRNVARFASITFPERCGFIEVCLIDGFVLGSYHPSVIVPRHPRIRLHGICAGNLVKWNAVCEPLEVKFDTDPVEFSDALDWQNTFMLLDLHFKTGKSNAETYAYKTAVAMSQTSGDSELKAASPIPAANLRPKAVSQWRNRARWMGRA